MGIEELEIQIESIYTIFCCDFQKSAFGKYLHTESFDTKKAQEIEGKFCLT